MAASVNFLNWPVACHLSTWRRLACNAKARNDVIDILTSEELKKHATTVPDVNSREFYDWCFFPSETLLGI